MATAQDNLAAARDALAATLAAEEAYQLANGPKPQYSLNGKSYDWPGWRRAALEAIKSYNEQIAYSGAPYEVQSGGGWSY